MFEKLIRDLQNLQSVSIPIEADKDGYIDRECPNHKCLFVFKAHLEDWKKLFKDEAIYCPMCGKHSTSDKFFTTEQVRNATSQAKEYIDGLIHNGLIDGASEFNRRQPRNGFIRMSMQVTGSKQQVMVLPIPAREVFERKIQCEKCNSRFAVMGPAFFCPCCGHNSVLYSFANSLEKIEWSINYLPTLRAALANEEGNTGEIMCRQLLEKGLTDCVVAFQSYCDVTYRRHPKAVDKTPFNAFQKLDVGGKLWFDLLGKSYTDWLLPAKYDRMNILFQRRHLLQHTEGVVDQKYIDKTGDQSFGLGKKILVREGDVYELLDYVKTITTAIKQLMKNLQ